MGHQVILTPRAIEDLRAIVEYIAADNPGRALTFGEELIERALSLGEWPNAGRMVPEIHDSAVRELIHQSYRIVFKIQAGAKVVYVVRFWHAARGKPRLEG
ncbi:MAG: type II toxin-antitoxin system RelE/ParE family toxin [Opitutales bacterium]|jgi:plasmid stabilization system protein ParE